MSRRLTLLSALLALCLFAFVPVALADGPASIDGPEAGPFNLYLVVLGLASPLVGYLATRFVGSKSELLRGAIFAAVTAAVGVLYQAATGDQVFPPTDATLWAALTTMVSAFASHIGFFSRPGVAVNEKLRSRR